MLGHSNKNPDNIDVDQIDKWEDPNAGGKREDENKKMDTSVVMVYNKKANLVDKKAEEQNTEEKENFGDNEVRRTRNPQRTRKIMSAWLLYWTQRGARTRTARTRTSARTPGMCTGPVAPTVSLTQRFLFFFLPNGPTGPIWSSSCDVCGVSGPLNRVPE